MTTAPALLLAAAGVGIGHAIMPDHWLPLATVGRVRRYSLNRVARLSTLAGVAHVAVSLLIGAVVIVVGLQFRSSIEHAQDTIVGGLLILTGLGFAALEMAGHGHHHGPGGHTHSHDDDHPEHHDHAGAGRGGLLSFVIPFGAAASPDLTILPVFLAAATAGWGTAAGTLMTFTGATIGTMVGLTLLACHGGYQLTGNWLERWGNAVTAGVLLLIGALVITGAI